MSGSDPSPVDRYVRHSSILLRLAFLPRFLRIPSLSNDQQLIRARRPLDRILFHALFPRKIAFINRVRADENHRVVTVLKLTPQVTNVHFLIPRYSPNI
ncbi:hypothetical protein Bamb_6246 [Burkholderia ambifaria AMMD]|uniref:Uncharacterized protein n=1 Tax=Burkholderia ambifaria (strain ATCC BAA-244 / DSM 16087 / CCUG 44356 / LMG 19182 / AMMD) TaxID=339670 RepID=Q0B233_BURCM|nr:hypothetical protein Bamb_6246 [Burkholderia ambifaria AMMD]